MTKLTSAQRRELVRAAEDVARRAFERGRPRRFNRTQLAQLINVCQRASCAEEIENYLKYQAGRDVWPMEFAKNVIAGAHKAMGDVGDGQKTIAWCHYATFLKRAFVYHLAT